MWTQINCQLVIIAAIILANYVNAHSEVDDHCNHNTKSIAGICKPLGECPTAIQDLQKGIYPQNCGFVGTSVIVCCTETDTTPVPLTTTTAKPTTSISIKTPSVGEKSRQACQNNEILAYKKQIYPALIDEEYDLVENCPWNYYIYPPPIPSLNDGLEFPHMALIGYVSHSDKYEWRCVGSLISDKFVLTAAQCTDANSVGTPQVVRLGDLDYVNSSDDKYVQQIDVKNQIKHPLYKSPLLYHDIALLELERPATLNLHVKPICLYTLDSTHNSSIVTGWNLTEQGKSSNVLIKWFDQYFSTETCNLTYGNDTQILPRGIDDEIQVCYIPLDDQEYICHSNLGGPIQIYNRDVYCSYHILGITSFGRGCSQTKIPVGFVKLYPYIEWIEGIVWP